MNTNTTTYALKREIFNFCRELGKDLSAICTEGFDA